MPHSKKNLNHKRTTGQREQDLVETTSCYIRGMTQQQIADQISSHNPYHLSRAQIGKDLETIRTRWRSSYLVDLNEHKIKELARIDELERAYWTEWESSRKPKEIVESIQITDSQTGITGKPTSGYSRKKISAKKEQRDGNAVFLSGIQWCISKRCEILGLNAPQTMNINWREEARASGVDPDEVQNHLYEQFMLAAGETTGHDG